MKVSIIGFNIFGIGGTTRSNLNLIEEFQESGTYDITYYNYTFFSRADIIKLRNKVDFVNNVKFQYFRKLFQLRNSDSKEIFYITRESFFPLAKLIRSKYPNAIILGEIHAPLLMLKDDDFKYLQSFSYVRVATDSIQKIIREKYNYDRVFTQTVSIKHLVKDEDFVAPKKTYNFLIFARFDDESKDISYAIKLFDYMVNTLGKNVTLYINGNGPSHILYKNLISSYNLEDYVFLNYPLPKNYIYLSTSRYETFGYSIVEAISKGRKACVFAGEDNVVFENFNELKSIFWITKSIIEDAKKLDESIEHDLTKEEYNHDMDKLQDSNNQYITKMLKVVMTDVKFPAEELMKLSRHQLTELNKEIIRKNTLKKGSIWFRRVYQMCLRIPLLSQIVRSQKFINMVRNILYRRSENNDNSINNNELVEHYVFVESFHGKNFSGDPKHLAIEISKKIPNIQVFVSSVNQLVDVEIRNYGFTPIRLGTSDYVEIATKCKYIIVNGNTLDKIGKNSDQTLIQTWHGFPIKNMVADLADLNERKEQIKNFLPRMQKWDYLLSASEYNTALFNSAFLLKENPELKIVEKGMPRNAYLLKNLNCKAEYDRIHFKYLNYYNDENKKYILFCPTWRKDIREDITTVNLRELITSLPDEFEIIVKLHPNEGHMRANYANLHPRIHCFFNELIDIQELYLISEILISDFSSAIFDFAHVDKRVIILQEDAQTYSQEIGVYFNIEELTTLKPRSYNTTELLNEILRNDDTKVYNQNIIKYLMNQDDAKSTVKIIEQIFTNKK